MAFGQDRASQLTARLKARGYRLTPQRRAVLRMLVSCCDHPSAEEIYARVEAEFPGTSLATIYKTLALLKEQGEISELNFGDGCHRYDCGKTYPHPHLVCVRCNRIKDFDWDGLTDTIDQVAQQSGYQIVNHRCDFFGVCPDCQKQETS
ncbi:MAG: transcriptional repressor [Anaerolineales bacterium]|nr:transcriptional repressor [Anaerolineales bacterium]